MARIPKITLMPERRNSKPVVSPQPIIQRITYFISGPLHWLMSREFSSQLSTYHVVLKVSPSFMGGRLHNRCVYTACPDPFLGENGLAPEGYIAASCTSNSAGAMLQHYHIPAKDLSPAPPRKKNQECLVLDGDYRGRILTIEKCNVKKNTVDTVTTGVTLTLRFDQICLVHWRKT
jgi:hypothetical protein